MFFLTMIQLKVYTNFNNKLKSGNYIKKLNRFFFYFLDYCNSVIKKGLEENRDFVILSHKVFKYLFKIYGGREIKRFVVNVNDENNLTHVEIWLKKVKIKIFINIIKLEDKFLPNLTNSK